MTCRWTLWRRQPWLRRATWPHSQLRRTRSPLLCALGWVQINFETMLMSAHHAQLRYRSTQFRAALNPSSTVQAQVTCLDDLLKQRCAGASQEGELVYDFAWFSRMVASDPLTCCFATTSRVRPLRRRQATGAAQPADSSPLQAQRIGVQTHAR
jgi:hypothetical protein